MFTEVWNRLEAIGATEGLNKELVHTEFINWLADLPLNMSLTNDDITAFILRRSAVKV